MCRHYSPPSAPKVATRGLRKQRYDGFNLVPSSLQSQRVTVTVLVRSTKPIVVEDGLRVFSQRTYCRATSAILCYVEL